MSHQMMMSMHHFWAALLVLFFVTFFLYKKNVEKGAKIVHMILRLIYIVMIVSGVILLSMMAFPFNYILKGILAISLMYFMEMILVKTKNGTADGKTIAYYWIMCIVTIMLVVLMGFKVISFS